MGPVINEGAMRSILNYIEVGKKEGRLIAGGATAPGDGYFVQPTVIADVDSKARIFQEEIFGPVLAVTKARDFDHALELANDSEYGLTGAVFTKNREKIRKAREQFFVGNLYINRKCTGAMVGAHPFGGFNMSGTDSKAGGPDYLLQFLQAKAIGEKSFVIRSLVVRVRWLGAPMRRGPRQSQLQGRFRTTRRRALEQSAPFSIYRFSRSRLGCGRGSATGERQPRGAASRAGWDRRPGRAPRRHAGTGNLFQSGWTGACRIRAADRRRCSTRSVVNHSMPTAEGTWNLSQPFWKEACGARMLDDDSSV